MIDEKLLLEELKERERKHMCDFEVFDDAPEAQFVVSHCLQELQEVMDVVRKQPRVSEWIPCSERLPEEDGEYLCWYDCGDGTDEDAEKGFMLVPYWTDIEMFGVYQDIFDSHTLGFVDSEFYECETAIAWQPLPAPYKEGEQS